MLCQGGFISLNLVTYPPIAPFLLKSEIVPRLASKASISTANRCHNPPPPSIHQQVQARCLLSGPSVRATLPLQPLLTILTRNQLSIRCQETRN